MWLAGVGVGTGPRLSGSTLTLCRHRERFEKARSPCLPEEKLEQVQIMNARSDKEGSQRPAAHGHDLFGPNMFLYKMELSVCRWGMRSLPLPNPLLLSLIS